jgi:exonuclease V gamma subunit
MRYILEYTNFKSIKNRLNLDKLLLVYPPRDEHGADRYDYMYIYRHYKYDDDDIEFEMEYTINQYISELFGREARDYFGDKFTIYHRYGDQDNEAGFVMKNREKFDSAVKLEYKILYNFLKKYYKDFYRVFSDIPEPEEDDSEDGEIEEEIEENDSEDEELEEDIKESIDGEKYTLDIIFKYSAAELDSFIAQFTNQKYENLYDKRYMTMYYLHENDMLDYETKILLNDNGNKFREALEISNTAQELRKNLV